MNNEPPPKSTKSLKRKRKSIKKKKKKAEAAKENDSLNSNIVCESENSITDRSKALPVPSIGKSVGCLKKKLLILDINGILVDVVSHPFPKKIKRDAMIAKKALFKRPFCSEFLNFCFEKFDVAVWSSRMEKNVNSIINHLLGNMSQRLIFCWNISQCTKTNIKALGNNHKLVVFKDLRRIWDKYYPDLPWEKGYYNESNTLLLDDSPYKGLLNPPHNSIYPPTFSCRQLNDSSLGVGGLIRNYLERLANAENVSKFVEQNPFGQKRISETSESWSFYCNILHRLRPKN
ncbi:uncharacterized protein LOC127128663 isoform X2 [Lathyrus oleraceus]|uniref:Mitochondrial import inner membrane translocase subunit TIM50 n=1 Tax=Pisum sativum TaxID=3888 RepID=A0A9D5B7Q7_PEA|nr:uncharacterized protein LOC127128663 isoform X2 [Pisum sativum]KAI5432279.1 hypothetical protein KIW84_036140 [Pisum sativum]